MTKEERKQIDNAMRKLAETTSSKVKNFCATISIPYELEALKLLRKQIDIQIEALETYLDYTQKNSI